MFSILKQSRGFTFLDTTLSMFLLSLTFTAGMMLLQNNIKQSVNSEMATIATNLATEKMEIIMAENIFKGYDYVNNSNNYPAEKLENAFKGFKREVIITEVNSNDLDTPMLDSGISKIEVAVSWAGSYENKIKISTLVAKYD